jgi:hypothetical protein
VVIVFLSLSLANPISFNISNSSLLKRAAPPDQGCHPGDVWEGRYCNGNVGPGAYRDQCAVHGDQGAQVYYIDYQCTGDEQCFEWTDADGDRQTDSISVPRTPDRDDVVTTKMQYGKRKFNTDQTPNLERLVSVKLQEDIGPSSSVSAHIMG